MDAHDRGYRPDVRSYNGDRGLEIVTYRPPPPPPPPANGYSSYDRPPRRSSSQVSSGLSWGFNDPEMKRKRRVASYKAYSVEGRVKASVRKGLRWIKTKCSELVNGW